MSTGHMKLVLDLVMNPVCATGMDGLDCTRQIDSQDGCTQILLLSRPPMARPVGNSKRYLQEKRVSSQEESEQEQDFGCCK
jgi:CheY-like chemotaxis protein